MSLKDKLSEDLKSAMKTRDVIRTNAIRMLKAAISNYELTRSDPKNQDHGKPLTDDDLLGVIEKQIKQRRETMELYKTGNRPELAAKESAEIRVLETYLPKQLTRDEIKSEVQGIIDELGTRNFPKVIREASARLKGRADGRITSEVVKELTS